MNAPSREKTPSPKILYPKDLTRELSPGTRIDRYEVIGTLGTGGCGIVYGARHVHLDRKVALKMLHRNLLHSEEAVERFFREARAAAAVGSPHIVRVLDCGTSVDDQPFLAMEFLNGMTLGNLLEGGRRLPLERAVDITLQTLDGISAAHNAGIVHRDLKPGNIFLIKDPDTGRDFVKILDFGVSKVHQSAYEKALTGTGALLGTPRYMAPEQFKGAHDVDHRADLFAVAVVFFQMLSGQLPFKGESPMELAHHATIDPPQPLEQIAPGVPVALCQVVYRGLEKEPVDRWTDAGTFAAALREAMTGSGFGSQAERWGSGFKTVQDLSEYADELRALEAEAAAEGTRDPDKDPSSPAFRTLRGVGEATPADTPEDAPLPGLDDENYSTLRGQRAPLEFVPPNPAMLGFATVRSDQISEDDLDDDDDDPTTSRTTEPSGQLAAEDLSSSHPGFDEKEEHEATVPHSPNPLTPERIAELDPEPDDRPKWRPPPPGPATNVRDREPTPPSGWGAAELTPRATPALITPPGLIAAPMTIETPEPAPSPGRSKWVFWLIFALVVAFAGLAFGTVVALAVVASWGLGG
jgi:tRNA A-37 threonylcarbamoyl transferase component Bud32